jgi:hypothetical protein
MGCRLTGGIIAECDDLIQIGGLYKKSWLGNVEDLTLDYDEDGYVNDITMAEYGFLYAFESKKNSFSAGHSTGDSGAGANKFFIHTGVLKLFPNTPAEDEAIKDLLVSSVFMIVKTQNDKFLIYGAKNGMNAVTEQNSGQEAGSDITEIVTLKGEEKTKPLRIKIGADAAATEAVLDGLLEA